MAQLSLLESVHAAFGGAFVKNASAFLGDPENDIHRNLDAIIPVTLAAIIHKAETGTADSVAALASDAYQSDRYSHPAALFTAGGEGVPAGAPDLIKGVFGERFGAIANVVASFTGGRSTTVSALFGSVVSYALWMIGRHMREYGVSAGALSSTLTGQKSSVWAAVPSDLNLASLLGVPARPSPSYVTAKATPPERGKSWLAAAVLVLVLGGVAWWWLLRSRTAEPVQSAALDTALRPPAAPSVVPEAPPPDSQAGSQVSLPNGVKLAAARGGFEDRLVAFLSDSTMKPDENLWFDFTHVDFEPGSARIIPASRGEITNLVKILKAFPRVRIKIGGFTDSTGTESANIQLSKARADAVARELQAGGVAGQIAGVDGYGSAFAKVSASAPEAERRRDRRLGVAVWVR